MRGRIKLALWVFCLLLITLAFEFSSRVACSLEAGDAQTDRDISSSTIGILSTDVKAPLTLDECIKIAIENNPDIKAGQADIEAARAAHDEAMGRRWPSLSMVGGYTRHLDDQRLLPARKPMEPGVYADDLMTGDLVMRLPVFTGGLITNEIKASELLRQSTEHRLTRTRRALIFNVSSVFYSILGQDRVIESVAYSKKALERHQERVRHLISAKKAAKVDLLRTDVQVADILQRLVQEQNVLDIQYRLLANLLGIEKYTSPLSVQGILKLEPFEMTLESCMARARGSRADYKAFKTQVEAQARQVDIARAGHWPTVSLQGSYGGRWAPGSAIEQPGADDSEDVGRMGLVVDFPIFQGGSVSASVRKEAAKLRSREELLRKLDLQIRLEVETALLNITSNLERVRASEKAIQQGKESLRIEQEKYELGRGSITDVLDAQSALLVSQTNYFQSLVGYNTAIAQLHLAMGEE